ncbi:MAG: amylo-alpha-1,6-glucosidase [Chloroflexota bacterium]
MTRAAESVRAPLVSFGPEIAADLEPAVRREWLVTNGIGGYACGTLAGIASRVYHGLLVASLQPPVDRVMVVGALAEWVTVDDRRVALHTHEYAGGTLDQRGFERVAAFALDGRRPTWTFDVDGIRLVKQVWMAWRANTTFVRYAVSPDGAQADVAIELTPLVAWRDHHAAGRAFDPPPGVEIAGAGEWRGLAVEFPGVERRVRAFARGGDATADPRWFYDFHHREETNRGLPDETDLFAPGTIRRVARPGVPLTIALTIEDDPPDEPDAALAASQQRDEALLATAGATDASALTQSLVLAADAFLVERDIPVATGGKPRRARSVIAGYPWFNDWGRDTMISLPGLCLATRRFDEARTILTAFAAFVADGLLPNNLPDTADEEPGRNTADASLWYPLAARAYVEASGDTSLVEELLPTFRDVLDRHLTGTLHGIRADGDGLLPAGEPGVQLTWMDARVGDRVITPRIGKPVEIQALRINALRTVGGWIAERGERDPYGDVADRATTAFRERFWRPELGYLADVVDGPDGDDLSLRPNQLFALSLPHALVTDDVGAAVLATVERELETPLGLRSLVPSDAAYAGRYGGDASSRDAAYHQGTTWAWLAGAYAEALARFGGPAGRRRAIAYLAGFEHHLADAGLGSISEIFDGDPPWTPRGAPWQAWSVAEVLRCWRLLSGE